MAPAPQQALNDRGEYKRRHRERKGAEGARKEQHGRVEKHRFGTFDEATRHHHAGAVPGPCPALLEERREIHPRGGVEVKAA